MSAMTRSFAVAVVQSTGTPRGQRLEHAHDAPVVGAEVVAPVADAVRLVDHEQADRARDDAGSISSRKRSFANRSGETSSRSTGRRPRSLLDRAPTRRGSSLLIVSARTPMRVGHLDLVAHQREQRRDEQRRPGALVAQQPRGDEVDGALAPPGALDDEDARRDRRATASIASSCPGRKEASGPSIS